MKLTCVQVKNFRNILNSGDAKIQSDVTCLVGKNESGKTAFLQALHRLNPVQNNVSLSIPDHYPAWLEKQHRRTMNLDSFCPILAEFKLEGADKAAIEGRFGKGVLKDDTFTLSRQYDGEQLYDYQADENVAIAMILSQVSLPKGISIKPTDAGGLGELITALNQREDGFRHHAFNPAPLLLASGAPRGPGARSRAERHPCFATNDNLPTKTVGMFFACELHHLNRLLQPS